MAVFRVEKNKDFTVMSNAHLRDDRLSLKAKGLLSIMLSLPEDWDYTIGGLATLSKDGKDAVRAAVGELEKAGYVQREQSHAEDGSFSGNVYTVHETPQSPLSGFPSTGNPSAEKPSTGNPTEQNTYQPSTDRSKDLNIPPYSPPTRGTSERRRRNKSIPEWKPERFEKFWSFYPRGENRAGAVQEWDKLKPDDGTLDAMARALKRQRGSDEWKRGVGIPHACRWLKNRRWEDEVKALPEAGDCEGDAEPHMVERRNLPVWT